MPDNVTIKTSLTPAVVLSDAQDHAGDKMAILNNDDWTFGTIGTKSTVTANMDLVNTKEASGGGLFLPHGTDDGQRGMAKVYVKHTGKTISGADTNQVLYIHSSMQSYTQPQITSTDYECSIRPREVWIANLNELRYYILGEYGGIEDDTPVIQYWFQEI